MIASIEDIPASAGPAAPLAGQKRSAILPNGAAYRDEEIHLFEFDDKGEVKRFRHFLDTAAMAKLTRSGQTSKAA